MCICTCNSNRCIHVCTCNTNGCLCTCNTNGCICPCNTNGCICTCNTNGYTICIFVHVILIGVYMYVHAILIGVCKLIRQANKEKCLDWAEKNLLGAIKDEFKNVILTDECFVMLAIEGSAIET